MNADERPTKKQQELLSYIDGFIKSSGFGPSYREVMRALDYKSVSTVAVHIDELIKKGHLIKRERSARSLEVVSNALPDRPTASTSHSPSWLIEAIETKFSQAQQTMGQKLIDDLYVLVGALHVLGLAKEHTTYKKRLLALIKDI